MNSEEQHQERLSKWLRRSRVPNLDGLLGVIDNDIQSSADGAPPRKCERCAEINEELCQCPCHPDWTLRQKAAVAEYGIDYLPEDLRRSYYHVSPTIKKPKCLRCGDTLVESVNIGNVG